MQNQYQFKDQVVVITGAGNGIGRATAIMMAESGAHVLAGDLNHLPENQETFLRLGITEVKCDVRQEADIQALIDQAVQQYGRIDVQVNNAGIGMVKPIHQVSVEEWDACIDTNLKGTFLGCKHAIRHMLASGGGSIINTASNAGLLPRAHDPVCLLHEQVCNYRYDQKHGYGSCQRQYSHQLRLSGTSRGNRYDECRHFQCSRSGSTDSVDDPCQPDCCSKRTHDQPTGSRLCHLLSGKQRCVNGNGNLNSH